jgi:tetratricopeptide (TPR) repeat protein
VRRSRLASLLLAFSVGACGSADDVGPPPRIEAEGLDPLVAELFRNLVQEADRDRESAAARGRLGLAYDVNSFPGAALAAFEQARSLDPSDPRWPYHAARLRASAGDVERALADLDVSIRLAPEYAPARWRKGKWLLDLGRLEEAEASFRECIRLEPNEPAGRIELARVHVQRGEAEQAIDLLEPLARAHPGDTHVQQLLAAAHRKRGDLRSAQAAVAAASEEKKRDRPDPWREEGRSFRIGFAAELERATALLDAGRLADGIAILERIRPLRPDDTSLLANLGAAYCAAGRQREGIDTLTEALRVRPGHAPSLQNLIAALASANRTEDALRWADVAVEANPGRGAARAQRAEVLVRLDRWEDAAVDLRAAVELDPGLEPARVLLARVERRLREGEAGGAR